MGCYAKLLVIAVTLFVARVADAGVTPAVVLDCLGEHAETPSDGLQPGRYDVGHLSELARFSQQVCAPGDQRRSRGRGRFSATVLEFDVSNLNGGR